MELFLKLSAGVLIAAILSLTLSKQGKDYALLLSLTACAMVVISAAVYLEPIISLLSRLVQIGRVSTSVLHVMLKIAGIGMISQIAGMVCSDSGNQALCKALQVLTTAAILWLAAPLLEEMISLMESVLEAV